MRTGDHMSMTPNERAELVAAIHADLLTIMRDERRAEMEAFAKLLSSHVNEVVIQVAEDAMKRVAKACSCPLIEGLNGDAHRTQILLRLSQELGPHDPQFLGVTMALARRVGMAIGLVLLAGLFGAAVMGAVVLGRLGLLKYAGP